MHHRSVFLSHMVIRTFRDDPLASFVAQVVFGQCCFRVLIINSEKITYFIHIYLKMNVLMLSKLLATHKMENLYSLAEAAQKQKMGFHVPGGRLAPHAQARGLGFLRCLQSHHFVLEPTLPVTVENGGFFLQWRMSACSRDRKGLCSQLLASPFSPPFRKVNSCYRDTDVIVYVWPFQLRCDSTLRNQEEGAADRTYCILLELPLLLGPTWGNILELVCDWLPEEPPQSKVRGLPAALR